MAETKTTVVNNTVRGGVGFFGMLAVLFIGLKLTGVINWSWFWVLLPLYWGPALILTVLLFIGVLYAIVTIAEYVTKEVKVLAQMNVKK